MKNKGKILMLLFVLCATTLVSAQTVEEFRIKNLGNSKKQLTKKPKKVFVNDFTVHFQFYNQKVKESKGGMFNKVLSGDAKAQLFVGLDKLTENDFKQITDSLFTDFKTQLQAKGYEILDNSTLSNIDALKDREQIKDYPVVYDEYAGIATVHPSNCTFFDYKESKLKPNYLSKISKDLDDAVVSNVELFVFFVEDKNSWSVKNKSANIKIDTQLRIVSYDHVMAVNEKKISKLQALTIGKKKQKTIFAESKVEFVCGRNSIGGSAEISYLGTLKDDVVIDGAFQAGTFNSKAKTYTDNLGKETVFGKVYETKNTSASTTGIIPVDVDKYKKGVFDGASLFLKKHIDNAIE